MPKAYWVVSYRSMKNPEAWMAYARLAVPAIESAGGRFLVRSNPAKIFEAGLNQRVVLVEFDSLDKALACLDLGEASPGRAASPRRPAGTGRVSFGWRGGARC